MPKEIKSRAIANGDETNPIQASVVVSKQDPTKYWLVICNPDGSAIGNPFDFLQLKTDYTPTGSEPVGTSYWDSTKDWPTWKTDDWLKNLRDYVETTNIQNFELELARKLTGNSYMEYTEVGGNITQVNYWTDSGKGTKLFTKDITYSGSNPTQIVMKDEITNKILTTTIAYSWDDIVSVAKVLS